MFVSTRLSSHILPRKGSKSREHAIFENIHFTKKHLQLLILLSLHLHAIKIIDIVNIWNVALFGIGMLNMIAKRGINFIQKLQDIVIIAPTTLTILLFCYMSYMHRNDYKTTHTVDFTEG